MTVTIEESKAVSETKPKKVNKVGYMVKYGFNNDFVELLNELKSKYGEKIFEIHGIGDKNLDITQFPKNFYNKSTKAVASVSIDDNANVSSKDISQYTYERFKPQQKLNSIYLLYKWVKKFFSKKDAKLAIERIIAGDIFVNDLTDIEKPYCFAIDLNNLLSNGMDFFDGRNLCIGAPKRSDSFIAQVIQTTAFISNQIMGAIAYPSFFPILDKFYRAEYGEDYMQRYEEDEDMKYRITNQFQNLIFSFNFPFRGNQSSFTNLSVLDKGFAHALFDGFTFADDGTEPNIDSFVELSKKFFEYFVEINNKEGVFTFPVMTLAVSLDENNNYEDESIINWISEVNHGKSIGNIFQSRPNSFCSCCFDGQQKVLTKSSAGIKLCTMREAMEGAYDEYRRNFTVFHNGSWCAAKPVVLNQKRPMFKVTTHNNKVLYLTDNHLNLTKDGLKETKDLVAGQDYLAFNTRVLDTFPEADRKLTYEQGVLIGAYLGDGSKYKRNDCNAYEVTFSLSAPKLHLLEPLTKALSDWGIDKELHIYDSKNNVKFVKIFGEELYNVIAEYVDGNNALEKGINPIVFGQSIDFRRGVLQGLYATDGGNSCRIYSSSERLIDDVEALCTTLGLNTIINEDPRETVNIRGVDYERNAPVRCIKWYNLKNKRGMGDGVKVINNTEYFQVKSIEPYDYVEDKVYCFQMENEDEPFFTLPNGVITHNCRLKNELDIVNEINGYGKINSFGASSGLSVGSHRVCGINLPRLAIKEKDNPNYLNEIMDSVHKILYAHRMLIKERINLGVLPLYTTGWMDLSRQYSTVGLIGGYEYVKNKGLSILTEEGTNALMKVMKTVESKILEYQKSEEDCIYNIESIPGESQAVKLCDIDKILGYCDPKVKLYSNQYVSLMDECSIYDRMKTQGIFDSVTSGGAIMHCTYKDSTPLTKEQYEAVVRMAKDLHNEYFAINYAYVRCANGHRSIGEKDVCDICGAPIVARFQRVVGFITCVESWNTVRREYEYQRRTSVSTGELCK